MHIFIIYVVVAIITCIVLALIQGRQDENNDMEGIVVIGLCWPVLLLLLMPHLFFGLLKLITKKLNTQF